jgi:hypothetical protein
MKGTRKGAVQKYGLAEEKKAVSKWKIDAVQEDLAKKPPAQKRDPSRDP